MNSHFQKTGTHTYVQSFQVDRHITSLRTELNGKIEWIYWQGPDIRIETDVSFEPGDACLLDYCRRKGHFQLVARIGEDHSLSIRNKRVNSQIFRKGARKEMLRSYRIYLPDHLAAEALSDQ